MKKILIVDDETKIMEIYNKLLTDEGFKVVEASNVHVANELLLREKIDLVLLDIKMPGVDGGVLYEVMKLFHKKTKVIISSVYPLEEQKRLIEGAEDYYDKSQGTNILLTKIKKILKDGNGW